MIKMLVLDLDDTLLRSDKTIQNIRSRCLRGSGMRESEQ